LDGEREYLKKLSPFVIIEYIKNSIEILINLKVEERLESEKNNIEKNKILIGEDYLNDKEIQNENSYEILLRKHESDIRNHIKVIR
jgi:hypothetical protein